MAREAGCTIGGEARFCGPSPRSCPYFSIGGHIVTLLAWFHRIGLSLCCAGLVPTIARVLLFVVSALLPLSTMNTWIISQASSSKLLEAALVISDGKWSTADRTQGLDDARPGRSSELTYAACAVSCDASCRLAANHLSNTTSKEPAVRVQIPSHSYRALWTKKGANCRRKNGALQSLEDTYLRQQKNCEFGRQLQMIYEMTMCGEKVKLRDSVGAREEK